jgi:hypothetical protein
MMDLDMPETCTGWRNILRISCASSWFSFPGSSTLLYMVLIFFYFSQTYRRSCRYSMIVFMYRQIYLTTLSLIQTLHLQYKRSGMGVAESDRALTYCTSALFPWKPTTNRKQFNWFSGQVLHWLPSEHNLQVLTLKPMCSNLTNVYKHLCDCSLSYPGCKAHMSYYTVICGLFGCTIVFHMIS